MQEPESPSETTAHTGVESPAAAEEADAVPMDEPEHETAGARAKNFRGRWDHLDEQERRVVELTAKRGLSLGEAYRAVYGEAMPAAPAKEEAVEGAVSDLDQKIAAQQRRLDELKLRKAEAKGDLTEYDAAAEAYLEAREALRDLRQQRERAAEQLAAEALEERRRAEAENRSALAGEYPDALTPGTELYEACQEEMDYLRASNSPLAHDPHGLYKVARRLARALGIPKNTAPQPQAATAPRRTVRPVPAGGAPVETPAAALERRLATARSQGAMLDLMREIGTPFEALIKR